jgi:uncharacterized membrane protein YeaQ/YmgE (transglycosylase-associated protein family)
MRLVPRSCPGTGVWCSTRVFTSHVDGSRWTKNFRLAAASAVGSLRTEELNKGVKCCVGSRLPMQRSTVLSIIWTIIIGFIAGVVAKFLMAGDNEPSGFILTTILGIVGAFVATYLGQSLGWYRPGEGAGLIGAIVGAVIVLLVYGFIAGRRRTV